MKYAIFILVLFSSVLSSQSKSANIIVNYETKLISDSLNREKITLMHFSLLANGSSSIYFNREAKDFYDALSGKKNQVKQDLIITSVGAIPKYPRHNGSVYRDGEKIIASLPVGKYIFSFEEPKLNWQVLPETKKIKDFNCQLAKTITDNGDVFFAWFTADIPITDGPFRFKGLSGLVLEVYNKSKTIFITATDINQSTEDIEPIQYVNNVTAKSKKQYIEARNNFIENPAIYNGNIRIFDEHGNETTRMLSQKLKKINVFLD